MRDPRAVVKYLIEKSQLSERSACRLVGMSRSAYKYQAKWKTSEITQKLKELAKVHPRYGSPRLTILLRRQGYLELTPKILSPCAPRKLCVSHA